MKVNLLNRNLWKEYYVVLSVISVIASLLFLFLKIPDSKTLCCFIGFVICLVVAFLIVWYRANHISTALLNINNSILEIREGDIFKENGFKIINFNEFFDTQVDDIIISKQSLNSEYITHFYPQVSDLDTIISSDAHSAKCILGKAERTAGKTLKYKLGTIIKNGEYFLLAFSHFDEDNRAYLEINDFIDCLINMWNECDIYYGGNTVVLPLLGSGITRFRGYENITDQELLEILIWSFKMSRIRFQYPARAKIILTKDCLSKINLYDIKHQYK